MFGKGAEDWKKKKEFLWCVFSLYNQLFTQNWTNYTFFKKYVTSSYESHNPSVQMKKKKKNQLRPLSWHSGRGLSVIYPSRKITEWGAGARIKQTKHALVHLRTHPAPPSPFHSDSTVNCEVTRLICSSGACEIIGDEYLCHAMLSDVVKYSRC